MREPHLAIFEYGGELETAQALGQLAFWACLLLTIFGAGIIFHVVLESWNGKAGSILSAWPLTYPQSQLPLLAGTADADRLKTTRVGKLSSPEYLMGDPRLSARQPFAGKSSFPLLTAFVFLLTFISITVLQADVHGVPTGLSVHLPRPVTSAPNLLGMHPVLVRVELTTSMRPQLYIDDQATTWEDFDSILQKKLTLRPPNWPVYVEGDPDLEWKWVLKAVDRIRGLQADVTLLSRRTKSARQSDSNKNLQTRPLSK